MAWYYRTPARFACSKASKQQWEKTFDLVIDDLVKRLRPVVAPKPCWELGPGVVIPWVDTYGYGSSKSEKLYLPFQKERKIKDRRGVWYWVFACYKIRAPPSMGMPHPEIAWPDFLYLWVGPDGHPIRRNQEGQLLKQRKELEARQRQVRVSSRTQELGLLRADLQTFGVVIVDPPLPPLPEKM
jgi:hypothetical protein